MPLPLLLTNRYQRLDSYIELPCPHSQYLLLQIGQLFFEWPQKLFDRYFPILIQGRRRRVGQNKWQHLETLELLF